MPPKTKKAPKDSSPAVNGNDGKVASGTTTLPKSAPAPAGADRGLDDTEAKGATSFSKPDQIAYHAEQDKLKGEIDALQVKLSAVKEKIALASKGGPSNDRRATLRAELDALRGRQSSSKSSRTALIEQMKGIQDGIQKKIKDLQAAKTKAAYKTVAEVDARVKQLETDIESGTLKLGDEKRALQEISLLRRSRRTVESFQADQEAIEADRARSEELRKQLDDPEAKAVSERYDAIKAELDELKKDSDEAYAGRNKLFDERNALSAELDALYAKKRETTQSFREASDRYWQKVNEERARRAERLKAQRAAEEAEKQKEVFDRILEAAQVPAFQQNIEDCQTLIDYFSAKVAGGGTPVPPPSLSSTSKLGVAGVPKLELRQVTQDVDNGMVVRKKKGEEECYFVGGKTKSKKNNKAANPSGGGAGSSSSTALNIPLPTLTALLDLSIPPPTSTSDLPRVIEDLKTKRAWFEANQDRTTAENIAKAKARIQQLAGEVDRPVAAAAADAPLPNGKGDENPAPTANGDKPATDSTGQTVEEAPEEDPAKAEDVPENVVDAIEA